MPLDFDVIVFHEGCPDGITSLWCANHYKKIETAVPCRAGQNPTVPIETFTDKNVLFVDVCPKREFLVQLSSISKQIVILDHHETNKKVFDTPFTEQNITSVFDMSRAGCQITWDYFFPEKNEERVWFVDYVADRDLWKWLLPNSRQINCCFMEEGIIDSRDLTKLDGIVENQNLTAFKDKGEIYCNIYDKEIEYSCKNAVECMVEFNDKTYRCWITNVLWKLRSDCGNMLTKKKFNDETLPDFSAMYYYDYRENNFWISVRAPDTSDINLCPFAERYGGGGHPKACGLTIKNGVNGLQDVFKIVTQQAKE